MSTQKYHIFTTKIIIDLTPLRIYNGDKGVMELALKRKHFQLTEEQVRFLEDNVRDGVSESDIIRAALEEYMKKIKNENK